MSFLSLLRGSRDTGATALHLFLLNYKPYEKCVHAFFEGRDDFSFYSNFIRMRIPTGYNWESYVCGRKNNVYYLFSQLLQRKVNPELLLFFVDKDLSDYLDEKYPLSENIFITIHYSIENYLVTKTMFKIIWVELLGLTENRTEMERYISRFEHQSLKFVKFILPIMAFAINEMLNKTNILFDNLNLNELLFFDTDLLLVRNPRIKSRIKWLRASLKLDFKNENKKRYQNIIEILKGHDSKRFLRGKFELWYLINFCNKLVDTIKASGLKIKIRTPLNETNAVEVLGPRLPEPPELGEFLNKRFTQLK